MNDFYSFFTINPRTPFVHKLPNGEKEFFCFIGIPFLRMDERKRLAWRVTAGETGTIVVSGEHNITEVENKQEHRVFLDVPLPAEFETGNLSVKAALYEKTWKLQTYAQKNQFRLPLAGQVKVLHSHRTAHSVSSRQFGWDLVPTQNDGFGQSVLAPADGVVMRAIDGNYDLESLGKRPENLDYFLEDFSRYFGNHVILKHENNVWSCLAQLRNGSLQVQEGQAVKVSEKLGELGNSGFSAGPHVHLHFMDGPDILKASPLPIELHLERGTYAPQAGDIISS